MNEHAKIVDAQMVDDHLHYAIQWSKEITEEQAAAVQREFNEWLKIVPVEKQRAVAEKTYDIYDDYDFFNVALELFAWNEMFGHDPDTSVGHFRHPNGKLEFKVKEDAEVK